MSDNTSRVAGFLTPIGTAPPYDSELDDAMHDTVVGITGLVSDFVVPRWQTDSEGAELPPFGSDWCAQGIVNRLPDAFASEVHDPAGDGTSTVQRNEVLIWLVSFYGPHADHFESLFRSGLQLGQNRAVLQSVGVAVTDLDDPILVPDLVKMQWLRRVDVRMNCRRSTSYTFGVKNLLGAQVTLNTDTGVPPQDASTKNPDPLTLK